MRAPTTAGRSAFREPTYAGGVARHPDLLPTSFEPVIDDPAALRAHRRRRVALAYRLLGALHWGEQGDGHVSGRDPERTDCFWILRYGVPFGEATVADLVLVGPGGDVLDGHPSQTINIAAYNIHWPILQARPDAVSAVHTHTPYGTPWSASATAFRPIIQEACAFVDRHAVYDGEDVEVTSDEGGKRIAAALGDGTGVILRNHGLLTVGGSVDEAMGWFLMMERVAEAHVKARDPQPISVDAAREAQRVNGRPSTGWKTFNYALRARVPDPSVVEV
jgi:ribulose-5-phosphate 4-epimerase/fuculose-1-phosphate aldolase